MRRRKIGIMGGTFNPIHNGHIALAEAAYRHCELDEVWFMPSGVSYLKKYDNIVNGESRLEMALLATSGVSYFSCSDMEIKRGGNTYTVDTMRELNEKFPEWDFYFIMGADSLFGFPKWRNPEEIARLCVLVAVVRDDVDYQELELQKKFLEDSLEACVVLVPFGKMDISSSEIRSRLYSHQSVDGFLPEKVLEYIQKNKLYTEV